MHPRQRVPRLWVMSDPRGGDPLTLFRHLPRGSGIVLRHFGLPERERHALFGELRAEARRRGGMALLGSQPDRRGWWQASGDALAVVVHHRRELVRAARSKADLIFVSPVFATRTHPEMRPLKTARLGLLLQGNRIPAIGLGGMTAERFRRLHGLGLHGWAGIDAFKI